MAFNPRPRVLYVDDHEDCGAMVSALLTFSQIDTRVATTAAQALSLIKAESFDLYLLEAWLPDVDGFELCRQMRDANPATPILFFSGAAYEADRKKGLEAGANAYVYKPDIQALLGNISYYVSPAMVAIA